MRKPKEEPVKVEPTELVKEPLKEPVIQKKPDHLEEPQTPIYAEQTTSKKEEKKPVGSPEVKVKPADTDKDDESNQDDDPSKDQVSKDKPARYHVSQNKYEKSPNFKKWRIRQEWSTKTIKFYETQKEAIEAASDLAERNNTTIVIHKMDGSIRKQDYTKK